MSLGLLTTMCTYFCFLYDMMNIFRIKIECNQFMEVGSLVTLVIYNCTITLIVLALRKMMRRGTLRSCFLSLDLDSYNLFEVKFTIKIF